MTIETDPAVLRRVFPATVTIDGQTTTNALVLITRQRVYVWASRDRPILDEPYTATGDLPHVHELRRRPMVLTIGAATVTVERGRGCGCGNALKGWQLLGANTAAR